MDGKSLPSLFSLKKEREEGNKADKGQEREKRRRKERRKEQGFRVSLCSMFLISYL